MPMMFPNELFGVCKSDFFEMHSVVECPTQDFAAMTMSRTWIPVSNSIHWDRCLRGQTPSTIAFSEF
jgi:hypothetical protein